MIWDILIRTLNTHVSNLESGTHVSDQIPFGTYHIEAGCRGDNSNALDFFHIILSAHDNNTSSTTPEEFDIVNSKYIRVSTVLLLIIGIITLFFCYYNVKVFLFYYINNSCNIMHELYIYQFHISLPSEYYMSNMGSRRKKYKHEVNKRCTRKFSSHDLEDFFINSKRRQDYFAYSSI
ncbi:variable surface protein [Plasmodium gonderi]|uniref:Variable surface protein n=1 Tax=Plasmodium gonderi TaxID=77519 RepID=A0A1Y1JN87_PLAGO|nr:variable surface protein [Plasmodium gonderi]GAW83949.1 variable surface protein [Plasmodium gonderi]